MTTHDCSLLTAYCLHLPQVMGAKFAATLQVMKSTNRGPDEVVDLQDITLTLTLTPTSTPTLTLTLTLTTLPQAVLVYLGRARMPRGLAAVPAAGHRRAHING